MRLIDADALKNDLITFFPNKCLEGITTKTLFNQILTDIDNAPTVEETILKSRDVNKCLNCSYCCEASINSKGEVFIMCNLDAQCPNKEGKE